MLTIRELGAGDLGGYYLNSLPDGPAGYYLAGPVGSWLSKGPARLGLTGPVDANAFGRVLAGRDPASDTMLVSGKAAASGRTPGFDLSEHGMLAYHETNDGEVARGPGCPAPTRGGPSRHHDFRSHP
jgi:hypothetical protein